MSWTTFYPSDMKFQIKHFIIRFECPACGETITVLADSEDYWLYGKEVVCLCGSSKFSIDVKPRFVVQTDDIKS